MTNIGKIYATQMCEELQQDIRRIRWQATKCLAKVTIKSVVNGDQYFWRCPDHYKYASLLLFVDTHFDGIFNRKDQYILQYKDKNDHLLRIDNDEDVENALMCRITNTIYFNSDIKGSNRRSKYSEIHQTVPFFKPNYHGLSVEDFSVFLRYQKLIDIGFKDNISLMAARKYENMNDLGVSISVVICNSKNQNCKVK